MFRKTCRQDPERGDHKFLPRYTESDNGIRFNSWKSGGGHTLEDFRRLSIIETYLYSICEYCGKRSE